MKNLLNYRKKIKYNLRCEIIDKINYNLIKLKFIF